MKTKRAQRFLLVASLTLPAGCENAVSISGTVVVPVDVRQLFSAERPGVVMIWGTMVGGNGESPRYLCAPQQQALTLPYRINTLGCEQEQLLEARAFLVAPDRISQVHCDQPGTLLDGGGLRGEELAYGAATIFQGHHGGPCTSGSASVDVTMAVGAAPP